MTTYLNGQRGGAGSQVTHLGKKLTGNFKKWAGASIYNIPLTWRVWIWFEIVKYLPAIVELMFLIIQSFIPINVEEYNRWKYSCVGQHLFNELTNIAPEKILQFEIQYEFELVHLICFTPFLSFMSAMKSNLY